MEFRCRLMSFPLLSKSTEKSITFGAKNEETCMLQSLYIKNYALIDTLQVDFHPGFSVVTGETGAGKSIILGALSLILGQRADSKSIKAGQSKCVVEGTFDVSRHQLQEFCNEQDIEYDAHTFILRREISAEGKSRAFINDTPATLVQMKELGMRLIDIHSQHKNSLLGDTAFQLEVVDVLAGAMLELDAYRADYKAYRTAQQRWTQLQQQARQSSEEEEFLRFRYDELKTARLAQDEVEQLEEEQTLLTHAEDIKTALYKAANVLSEDDTNVLNLLREALGQMQSLVKVFPQAEEFAERLQTAYIDLKDLAPEVGSQAEDIEYSPERMEQVNNRLDLIYSLLQKHKVQTVAELLDLQQQLQERLEGIESLDDNLRQAEKDVQEAAAKMEASAKKLSQKRKTAKPIIEKTLVDKLSDLGMPNVRFEYSLSPKSSPDVLGADDLQFLFSANKNTPLQPVSEVASGGEISRVMLCIKALIARQVNLPTIIFDEIDTGVSGEVADKMGRIMQAFGTDKQVLAITHLPQIASKGDHHYFVYKQHGDNETHTHLRELNTEERTRELAQMLSGSQITEAAIQNAKMLLQAGRGQ